MESRLKNLRQLLDITQQELADEIGISRQSLIALERGKCRPSIDLASEIASFFEMPTELIFDTKNRSFKKREPTAKRKDKRELMPWSGSSPFREMQRMHDEIDHMFEDSFFEGRGDVNASFGPAVNVINKKDKVVVEADLPGITERDIDIEVGKDAVKITGEKKESKEVKKEDYYHRESSYGSFSRIVALPAQVKPDRAKAELKDGKLEIVAPKTKIQEAKVKKLKPKKK